MTDTEGRYVDDPAREARVAAVLSAAAAPVEPGPLPGEEAALAAFGAVHRRTGRLHMRSSLPFKAGLAAAVGAGVFLTGGVAAAATGTLPGAAQQTAHTLLGNLGVTVPGPNEHAAGHADGRGTSGDHVPATTDESTDTSTTPPSGDQQDPADGQQAGQGKGNDISKLATTTTLKGVEKGAAISSLASGGKSQAGQHGQAGTDHSQAGADHGTTGTDHSQAGQHRPSGDQGPTTEQPQAQSGTASAAGQSKAADASAGRSTTGRGTQAGHRP